ncbi:MAG: 50S ribosomal protein L29 [Elusimicrobia bacterium]|nr:50S ribosomal protein L29 [Elusimicrobiota bacterium]
MKRKDKESMSALSPAELQSELDKRRRQLFEFKFQGTFRQAKNPLEQRSLRKDIARMMTWIRQKKSEEAAQQ